MPSAKQQFARLEELIKESSKAVEDRALRQRITEKEAQGAESQVEAAKRVLAANMEKAIALRQKADEATEALREANRIDQSLRA